MINLNDIFVELSKKELCLKVCSNIEGQDTNYEELYCQILDGDGNILLYFDYQLDHKLHGGNILPYSLLNDTHWYQTINNIEELLTYII